MVAGLVGSGKSTRLKACLGEVPCLKGFIYINVANVAYCGTKTWIRNRSIRDNICDSLPYEEEWYRTILHATALDRDIDALAEKSLTHVIEETCTTMLTVFARRLGGWSMVLYAGALVVGLFSAQFTSLWVQCWAEMNIKTPFGQLARYICIYTFLAVAAAALWAYCMWLVFCRIVPTSSSRLHEHLVTKIKDAPLYWHTSTDTGVILNRFSQDMTMIECSLPVDFLKHP
ncbi:uncharacterized protein BO66DRAFT_437368 [Aspergillus aculeatinus CBS 121060]|uniref:Uncharacterized protein n=1 Tax=Aspergillus aculeatinus CBS 121060 TaxID=1448322 RepID=A0ACD1HCS2_9EURO|nr:hypothetical protein BO66DRAFT_437368 [Aspergillus aculeatinus CBS 121060]RAH71344.1 hypothetical protein BO66DRAFT_437368 [Aspergillus aculeatinus CBS 121060]